MYVRSPVNVIPRDVFGIPILELSLLLRKLPPKFADAINAPLLRLLVGDITKLGLKKLPYGTLEQIQKNATIPLLDIGTVEHIRKGHIRVYENIDHIEGRTIHFSDGVKEEFDAIVAGIGYYRDYEQLIDVDPSRFDDLKQPVNKQQYFGKDGLYFCGFWISPTGQIREIGLDARKITKDIAEKERNLNQGIATKAPRRQG